MPFSSFCRCLRFAVVIIFVVASLISFSSTHQSAINQKGANYSRQIIEGTIFSKVSDQRLNQIRLGPSSSSFTTHTTQTDTIHFPLFSVVFPCSVLIIGVFLLVRFFLRDSRSRVTNYYWCLYYRETVQIDLTVFNSIGVTFLYKLRHYVVRIT